MIIKGIISILNRTICFGYLRNTTPEQAAQELSDVFAVQEPKLSLQAFSVAGKEAMVL